MLNHERIQLEAFVEKFGPADVVTTLADIFEERAATDKLIDDPKVFTRLAQRLRGKEPRTLAGSPVVTEGNLADVLEQAATVATGELAECLGTQKFNRNLAKLKNRS